MSENRFSLVQKSQNISKVVKFGAFFLFILLFCFKLNMFVFDIVVYCDKNERKERFSKEMSGQMYHVKRSNYNPQRVLNFG